MDMFIFQIKLFQIRAEMMLRNHSAYSSRQFRETLMQNVVVKKMKPDEQGYSTYFIFMGIFMFDKVNYQPI